MLLLVEHGIAYQITAEEFDILVADRAKGVVTPLDCYGHEVGGVLGDVSHFTQAAAQVLQAARASQAGQVAGMSPALTIRLAEVEALIAEETMYFEDGAEQAA